MIDIVDISIGHNKKKSKRWYLQKKNTIDHAGVQANEEAWYSDQKRGIDPFLGIGAVLWTCNNVYREKIGKKVSRTNAGKESLKEHWPKNIQGMHPVKLEKPTK